MLRRVQMALPYNRRSAWLSVFMVRMGALLKGMPAYCNIPPGHLWTWDCPLQVSYQWSYTPGTRSTETNGHVQHPGPAGALWGVVPSI